VVVPRRHHRRGGMTRRIHSRARVLLFAPRSRSIVDARESTNPPDPFRHPILGVDVSEEHEEDDDAVAESPRCNGGLVVGKPATADFHPVLHATRRSSRACASPSTAKTPKAGKQPRCFVLHRIWSLSVGGSTLMSPRASLIWTSNVCSPNFTRPFARELENIPFPREVRPRSRSRGPLRTSPSSISAPNARKSSLREGLQFLPTPPREDASRRRGGFVAVKYLTLQKGAVAVA
jgi:hypothetical protein